ncbi:unnamed protein product, partial [Prorocentrum cordatum]
ADAPLNPVQEDAVELPQQDAMELGMVGVDFNGAPAEAKRGPKQKVIAGMFANVATAVFALTCDAVPRDSVAGISKQGLYGRGASCQDISRARSGGRLGPALVKRVREMERRQVEEFQVFERAPKNLAKGKRVRDDERSDEDGKESGRSGFVAMSFAWDVRDDTFAGTPPLAAFRRASFLFQNLIMKVLEKGGFTRIRVTVQVYDHKQRLLMAIVHGDEFLAGKRKDSLDWPDELVRGHFKVNVVPRVGSPRQGGVESGSFLRRTVTLCPEGLGAQRDRKHVEILASTMLNMKAGEGRNTKRAIITSSRTSGKDCREPSGELSTEYATTYRSMAPIALYVVHDRFDIQQAVGYLMRGTVAPTWHYWLLLQRLASYLEQRPQFELFFEFQRMPKVIVAEVDSDWASEPGRRSVDGAFLFIGSHPIDGWHLVEERGAGDGFEMTLQVDADSSGARGIASLLGSGKVRHLETKYFGVQEKVRGRAIPMAKFHTDTNMADMQTKPLEGPRFLKLLVEMAPASPAVMVMGSPTARGQVWATAIAVFGSTLAIAFLGAWLGYRVCEAPTRFLKGLWELAGDGDDQIAQVDAPPGEEHLAIVESGVSRHTQTTPIKHYWTWRARELPEECAPALGHLSRTAQVADMEDLVNGA